MASAWLKGSGRLLRLVRAHRLIRARRQVWTGRQVWARWLFKTLWPYGFLGTRGFLGARKVRFFLIESLVPIESLVESFRPGRDGLRR